MAWPPAVGSSGQAPTGRRLPTEPVELVERVQTVRAELMVPGGLMTGFTKNGAGKVVQPYLMPLRVAKRATPAAG